jgi:hypothetical protein
MNIIHINNVNTKPMSSWMPFRTARYMDRSGGAVTLLGNVVDAGALGSVFFAEAPGERWLPVNRELLFVGLTDMRLMFDRPTSSAYSYRLDWKGPGGHWEELEDVSVSTSGETATLDFAHPFPRRSGIYQLRLVAEESGSADKYAAFVSFDKEQLVKAGLAALDDVPSSGGATAVTYGPPSAAVEQTLELIPDQNGFDFIGLPEMPELSPEDMYTLSEDGHSMVSVRTGTVYPNAAYPENQVLTAIGRNGVEVSYPYYEDAEGKRYFLTAHLWYLQRTRAIAQTETISKTDPLGAARLLYRFAQAYENYVPTADQRWHNRPLNITSGPPFNYWGGMWNAWYINDLNSLRPLFRAFANIQQTDALQVLGNELGVDVEHKIVEDMFLPSIDYVLSYPETLGNLSSYLWNGLIEAGKALKQPEYIHIAVESMNGYAEQRFLPDGAWYEVTVSYHNQATNGLISSIKLLEGYSDPVGYVSPRTGRRFDNLNLYNEFPILEKARSFPKTLVYPDNKVLPIQDTWASTNVSDPAPDRGSMLQPSSGIGRLSLGQGAEQAQLYMQFSPKYGHNHYDPLSINLYAEGQELLPDLGYTHSKYRYFSISTIGHNTVIVNGRNMTVNDSSRPGGKVEQFVTGASGGSFQAMRASQAEAYPETSEYSREPWMISFPDENGKGYVLDLFRVSGGDRHEYTLQGDANRDAYFQTGLPLSDYGPRLLPPGVEAQEAQSQSEIGSAEGHYPGYIYVKDVKQAQLSENRYRVTLATYGAGGQTAKLNVTGLLEDGSNELFLGRSPSIRSTRLGGREYDNNDDVSLHDMPKLVLRRDGTNLTSTFATVLEPYEDGQSARIEGIDRLVPEQAPAGAAAIRITYGNTTDIILSNPRHPDQLLAVGDISMRGEMGFIRLNGGAVEEMRLIGGTLLRKGSAEIVDTGETAGTILETKRTADGDAYNALVTNTSVSTDLIGRYVIVRHPDQMTRGYKIGGITQAGGRTDIVLAEQDPGFTVRADGSSELNYYPAKQWTGTHNFRIAHDKTWDGGSVPEMLPTGTVTGFVYDPYGAPVEGAVVNVSGYSGLSTNSDGNGGFTLANVPAGVRRATVATDVYRREVSAAVYVAGGQTAFIAVPLLGEAPPSLSDVTASAGLGMPLSATSSKIGALYLVPNSTLPYLSAIQTAAATVGASVYVTVPGVPVSIGTSGLEPGLYRAFSSDWQGTLSSGVAVQLIQAGLDVIDDNSSVIQYAGTWSNISSTNYYGGTVRRAQSVDAYADVPFYGSQMKVIGSQSVNGGYADIYVDGVWQATIDTYSSSTKYQQLLYETAELPEGVHTLRIVVPGTKREEAANYYVTLDAVRVLQANQIPPKLTNVTAGLVAAGASVSAKSSRDGMLYLVPDETEATRTAIEAAGASSDGRSAVVTAGVYGALDTTGLTTDLYRVYAIDGNGNVSIGSDGITVIEPVAVDVEDDSAVVAYSGTWLRLSSGSYSGGTVNRGGSAGAYADIPFYGTSAQLLGTLHVNNGRADIYVDGVFQTTIDLYSGSTKYQQLLYDTGPLNEGLHVIRVEAAWTKQASAQNYYVPLDVLRVFNQPALYDVTEGPLVAGQTVQATSTKAGTLYLVPASTAATETSIEAAAASANGRSTSVTAGVAGMLSTTGLATDLYKAYAIDASGNVTAGSAGIAIVEPSAAKIDDLASIISYSGTWTRLSSTNYWEGTVNRGQSNGAYADIPFYGTSAQLLGTRHVNNGLANIYIDGVFQATIDLYSGSTRYQQVLYDTGPLEEGLHVMRVEAAWTKHASAQNYYIILDALESATD